MSICRSYGACSFYLAINYKHGIPTGLMTAY